MARSGAIRSSNIRDIDRGYGKFMRQMALLHKQSVVTVGIHQDVGNQPKKGGGSTLVEVASAHEFGTSRIPQRSFIGGWFDENRQPNGKFVTQAMQQVMLRKKTKDQALNLIGLKFQGDIRKRISQGINPPLAALTIKRKGSSVPLIDTGQLRAGVIYQIDGRGGSK